MHDGDSVPEMAPKSNTTIDRDNGEWITDEFLQHILQNADPGQEISIVDKNISFAVGKGENYLSKIFRVEVEYKIGNAGNTLKRHLIVKGFPDGEYIRQFITERGVFDRELSIYHTALPEMHRFAAKRLQNKPVPHFSPNVLVTSRPNTIVLEDLKYEGFRMANRKDMLDLQHSRLVVVNLARLHGMSAALHDYNTDIITQYKDIMFCEDNRENMDKFVPVHLKSLLKVVQTWPGFETYAAKIEKFISTSVDIAIDICKHQTCDFQVLCHGDCWVNNYMFKYSKEDVPTDVHFVDFQLSKIGSPALDLSYFLYSSPRNVVRELHFEQLLKEYHDELIKILNALEYKGKIISLQYLKDEMKRVAPYGFLISTMVIPIVVADADDTPDLAELTEQDLENEEMDVWAKAQKTTRFKEVYQQLLGYFDELGIFD